MAVTARFEISVKSEGVEISEAISRRFDEFAWIPMYEVATATTDQDIPISTTTGITTIQAIYVKSNYAISLRQTASDPDSISITANYPTLIMGTSMTALKVSNASGSTALITLGIWGT